MLEKLTAMRRDEDGVSPVIGVILMVAVTVVLAAVIGAFVFGIGDTLSDPAPNADIAFDYDADNNDVVIAHDGGDSITTENTGELSVNADLSTALNGDEWQTGEAYLEAGDTNEEAVVADSISAGDVLWDSADGDAEVDSGDTIELNWESPDGDSSTTLGDFEAP